ncbi:LuxR C-terminal-related transcriptional regulator, partial [Robiginitalea sp.]
GLTNADIADNLCISIFTINNHRANILAKSGKSHISDVILELHETGY